MRTTSEVARKRFAQGARCANARGLSEIPAADAIESLLRDFSLDAQGLPLARIPLPLLVLNGADDQYIPRSDSLIFVRKENAEVLLVPGAKHCAAEVFARLVPTVVAWLGAHLGAVRLRVALLNALAKTVGPTFES